VERLEGPVIGSRLRHIIQNPYKILLWIRLGRGDRFLDIGCGRGFLTIPAAYLVGPGGRVYAVDKSQEYLGELDGRIRSLGLSNVKTLATDAAELEGVPDNAVDKACMMLSLHHIERREKALSILREKMVEGSSILVVDPIRSRMLGHGTAPSETLKLFERHGYGLSYFRKGLITWAAVFTV
jgi:ubiquinone/menaquinone biosynthesis C-methylase UbiE